MVTEKTFPFPAEANPLKIALSLMGWHGSEKDDCVTECPGCIENSITSPTAAVMLSGEKVNPLAPTVTC